MESLLWDPLRRKNVTATPEERVRQWFIILLHESAGVPMHQMMSEASLKFGEKLYRADIVVYDRNSRPLAVVECKRPEVEIDTEVLRQAQRYAMVLGVEYLMVTNGRKNYVFVRENGKFVPCRQLPDYEGMLARRSGPVEEGGICPGK